MKDVFFFGSTVFTILSKRYKYKYTLIVSVKNIRMLQIVHVASGHGYRFLEVLLGGTVLYLNVNPSDDSFSILPLYLFPVDREIINSKNL